jgi:hypothetical protein
MYGREQLRGRSSPGQEGHINVKFNTAGYGGKKIRESVRIQTNDPNRPWLGVVVTGMVEKFAEIRPERITLSGSAGQAAFCRSGDHPQKRISLLLSKRRFEEFWMPVPTAIPADFSWMKIPAFAGYDAV